MESKTYNETVDKIILEHNHYRNHPQMLPFIGNNYGTLRKLLIVGESHYLHNKNSELANKYSDIIKNWYSITHDYILSKVDEKIGKGIISCTNTRANLNAFMADCRTLKAYTIYKNVSDVAMQITFFKKNKIEPFTFMAYMNFFQRPADLTGEKLKPNKKDVEIARNVFSYVVNIIKPDYIFVVSSNVWEYLHSFKFDNVIIGHSCHPSCPYWYKS